MTEKIKAKRKLSNINFESEGSAVALVSVDQGGAANGHETLIFKSLNTEKITEQDIEKASKVTVTMSITEYLQKFFHLWYEDAEVLARVFGYDTTPDVPVETDNWYDNYINEKVEAVQIMKSLVIDKSEEETALAVSHLLPKDYLTIIKSQEIFEKNFDKVSKETEVKKSSSKSEGVTEPEVNVQKGSISPSVENKTNVKEDQMAEEFISKSALAVEIEKAVAKVKDELQVELQKSKDQVAELLAEKQEVVNKARKEKIKAVEADEAAAEELFKSLEKVDEATFEVVVKALQKKEQKVEHSDLLKEAGGNGRDLGDQPEADRTLEILKSKYAK